MEPNEIIQSGLYEAAVSLMDSQIREEVHMDLAPCSDLVFLQEYVKRHFEKYGEEFMI